jgi:protein-S-isoprenylcysteine O-methyltransferase Ste14
VFGAGVLLVVIGTVTHSLGAGWNVVVLQDGWLKLFTVLYLLIGIGILVEILRRLGHAFVAVRQQERAEHAAERGGPPT